MLANAADRANALAAREAAVARAGAAAARRDRPVALLFPGYEERESLLKETREIDQPWMFDVFRAVTQDHLVRAAALETGLAMSENLSPLAARINGETHLLLIVNVAPASLMSAAVIHATAQATAPAEAASTTSYPADQLKAWERPAAAVVPDATQFPDESRGRWLWLTALALMIVERVISQRARRSSRPQETIHTEVRDAARVA